MQYATQGLFDGLNEAIEKIGNYQKEITWRDYVYSRFRESTGAAAERRRRLALDLWGMEDILISRIPTLGPRLAAMYSGKTPKTTIRDVNELESMGLVERVNSKSVRAKISELMSFLPGQKKPT